MTTSFAANVEAVNAGAAIDARARVDALTKPLGSLGRLEELRPRERLLGSGEGLDEAYELETRLTAEFRASPDSREAAESFLEKRPPEYVDDRRR